MECEEFRGCRPDAANTMLKISALYDHYCGIQLATLQGEGEPLRNRFMRLRILSKVSFVSAVLLLVPIVNQAHCDTLNGPVVKAARKALSSKNANFILIWVQPQDEGEVRTAFAKTLKVRRLGKDARELADMYFFETVVRLHRAGEGEPYTGIKPADTPVDPIIEILDRAIDTGESAPLLAKFQEDQRQGVEDGLRQVMNLKAYDVNDVAAGREYVKSYVKFIHHVEHIVGGAE